MPIPSQNLTVRDPGMGIVELSPNVPLFLGCSEKGDVNVLYTFGNKGDVVDTLGQGPLPEAICHTLDVAGGPVLAMRTTGGTAGSNSAVTKTAIDSSTGTITVAGAPFDAYEAIAEITATGALGVARFRYSLDGGRTYSEELTVPSGGTYAVEKTNLTLTFVAGAGPVIFEDGDTHEFDCVAPLYTTTNLGAAITALLDDPTEFEFLVLTGESASAVDGATMFAALETHLLSLHGQFRFAWAIMDTGIDTPANVITAFESAASAEGKIAVCSDDERLASGKPFAGWGTPLRPSLVVAAARTAASLISTDLGRVADGPLPGVSAISRDEFRSEVLDQHKITTLRTWQGAQGFFLTQGRLKSPAGSDFLYTQHRRVMSTACDVVQKTQQMLENTGLRTNPNGTINEKDAQRWEKRIDANLQAFLIEPENAEGTEGHVSELQYRIDRTYNVALTNTVKGKVAIRPLAYAKQIDTELSYALNVGGA